MQKVSITSLTEGEGASPTESFTFRYPSISQSAVIHFHSLSKEMQDQIVPKMQEPYYSGELDRRHNEEFLVLTLEGQGYAGHAQRAHQEGQRILTAKEVMEQRVKYGTQPAVLGFLHELQERRYDGYKPAFQKDYEALCRDPELRWFAAIATSTALAVEGQKFMIIPQSQTLEHVAARPLILSDRVVEKEKYKSIEGEGYLFSVPRKDQRDNNFDHLPLYVALTDNDEKLVHEYQRTMAQIKFGFAGAQRQCDTPFNRERDSGLQARMEKIGYLFSTYSSGLTFPDLWYYPTSGLAPVQLKGFNSVLEFPRDYPQASTFDNQKVIRCLPDPSRRPENRQIGISDVGGCDPQDMRWDFEQLYSFSQPCTVVSVQKDA